MVVFLAIYGILPIKMTHIGGQYASFYMLKDGKLQGR